MSDRPTDSGHSGFFRRLVDLTRRPEHRRVSFGARLRRTLLVGFLVAFPLVVTLFFARFIFELLDRWFRPIARHLFGVPVPGAGLLLALVALGVLGLLATNVFGSRLLDAFERWISRLPLLSPIYQGARQITEAIHVRETTQFHKVVLLAFPHPGVRSIGFVTREFGAATRFVDEPCSLVFVPTTPNPTSGFLVAVPQRELVTLPMTVEEGIKLVISGGLLVPAPMLGGTVEPAPAEDEGAGAVGPGAW